MDCEDEHIGESGRTFVKRFKEYMKAPSSIHDHYNITVKPYLLKNLAFLGGRSKSLPDQSKKPFSSESVTHP